MQRFINRELSWLEFNNRVLDEARDPDVPLLERLKFLAITASNLDEFFMVRVGGLQLLRRKNSSRTDPAGMTAEEQLQAISERTHRMADEQYICYQEVEGKLADVGIRRLRPGDLNERQRERVQQHFQDDVYPVLTPVAVESSDLFPLLPNQVLAMAVRLPPDDGEPEQPRFAVMSLGRTLSRFLTLETDQGYHFMLLDDLVRMFASEFFGGETVLEAAPFRISRNADLAVREEAASDLLAEMESVLEARKQSHCVRLEVEAGISAETLTFLTQTLEVTPDDIYRLPGPLDLAGFMPFTSTIGFDNLRYDEWPSQPAADIDPSESIFTTLSTRDLLLYHPYESFEPVVRLIETAADDPDVLAIKQTLYRTSGDSPIVAALTRAAENGKHVTAIVELKARFDEARNIEWARNLEREGVQVIYGVRGLKTHAKICVIVRREPHGVQRYVHFGTGNYNEKTARLYTDVSLMTSDGDFGADATSFFNAITGYSQPQRFRKIDSAPIGLREQLLELIEGETQRKREGQEAFIVAKLNSLVDPPLIKALYAASQAGVSVDLNVRGICCLRPGVSGLSENIRVISVIDRYLEHARIMHFCQGGDDRLYISSADWMPRNLDRRVELLVPVEDRSCREKLIEILRTTFSDTVKARRLLPDGGYERVQPDAGVAAVRSQHAQFEKVRDLAREAEQTQRTQFVPHRASGNSE